MSHATDEDWGHLQQCSSQETGAFEGLVRKHVRAARAFAFCVVRDDASAARLVQESFAAIFVDRGRTPLRTPFRVLLLRTVYRAAARHPAAPVTPPSDGLDGTLAEFGAATRAALWLRAYAQLGTPELAVVLDVSIDEASSVLDAARSRVAEALAAITGALLASGGGRDERLWRFVDDELEPAARALFARELDRQPPLRATLEELGRTAAALESHFRAEEEARLRSPADEDRIVADIVAASREAEAKRSAARSSRPLVLVVVLGLVAMASLVLYRVVWADPDPHELLGRAGHALRSDFYELRMEWSPELDALRRLVEHVVPVEERIASDVRVLVGPDRLSHLSFQQTHPLDGRPLSFELACDGERFWTWKTDADAVKIVDPAGIDLEPPLRAAFRMWERTLAAMDTALRAPDQLRMLGRVASPTEPGGAKWWKIENGPDNRLGRAVFWVDDAGVLRRVAISGLTFDVERRPGLTRRDFQIESWHPDLPVKEGH